MYKYYENSPTKIFFPQVKKRRIFFLQTSYIKDTYVEAYEFRQGWSVAKNKGDEKKKTKEGGLSPQEGDVRKKEEKKEPEGEKVAPRRKGSVCPKPRNFFFGSRVYGL